jgi:ATPase subunit of ABC transporter with duplicated ATPase domains
METIDVLINALKEFKGAAMIVSHDQYFLKQVATVFWAVKDNRLRQFHDLAEAKAVTYHA